MNKLIVALIAVICGVSVYGAPDPVASQIAAARKTMMEDRDFAKAQAAYEKIVRDKDTTNKIFLSTAQAGIGMSLIRQGKVDDALVAFQKAINDYPDIRDFDKINTETLIAAAHTSKSDWDGAIAAARASLLKYPEMEDGAKANFYSIIGRSYYHKKDYDNALLELGKVLSLPKASYAPMLFDTQNMIGDIYKIQRKFTEANTAWMLAVQNNVWELDAKDELSVIWKTFDKISPKQVTTDAYKVFLENTIRATKAIDENARFLGKLKSELGKIKQ